MKFDESLVIVVTEVVRNQFKAIKKIFLSTVVITKNYTSNRCFVNIKIMVKNTLFGVLHR